MPNDPDIDPTVKPTCFVIIGFGIKTDLATGRNLDLEKSYNLLIKPVAEEKGFNCFRAVDITYSGSIEPVMFDKLLQADLVIADLSTSNANVFYELGIRHAFRPYHTIIISEDQLKYPFDINHTRLLTYKHLGDDISYDVVHTFRKKLGESIDALRSRELIDSPVYTFLNGLTPPTLHPAVIKAVELVQDTSVDTEANELAQSLAALVKTADDATNNKDFETARQLLKEAVTLSNDSSLLMRLVFATYRSAKPDKISALLEARRILNQLFPNLANDTGVIQLLGDIEYELYNETGDIDRLIRARKPFDKLHVLNPNYDIGLKLAYIISLQVHWQTDPEEKMVDITLAKRTLYEVVDLCEQKLQELAMFEQYKLSNENTPFKKDSKEKVLFALAEAHYALGQKKRYRSVVNDLIVEALSFNKEEFELYLTRWNNFAANQSPDSIGGSNSTAEINKPILSAQKQVEQPAEERDLVFISYSHSDNHWLENIRKRLFPAFNKKNIKLWDDEQIKPAEKYRDAINRALGRAMAAVLFVSTDFLDSKFINDNELPQLIKAAEEHGVAILWIAVDECLYEDSEVEQYQCLNNPKKPLTTIGAADINTEIVKICRKIRNAVFGSNDEV